MPFDVREYREFVELLYKHPEWRTELRQLLLTEEVLSLPRLVAELIEAQKRTEQRVEELAEIQKHHEERLARVEERLASVEVRLAGVEDRLTGVEGRVTRLEEVVAELAEAQKRTEQRVEELAEAQKRTEQRVEELAEAQRRTEQRVEELAEAQKRTEQRVEELAEAQKRTEQRVEELAEAQRRTEQQVQRLTDRVGQMSGDLLEIKYHNKAASFFGVLIRQAQTVDFAELELMVEGKLTEEQISDLLLLDLVVRGQLRHPLSADGIRPEVWLAIEVSSVVDREDVERARRRAGWLRKAGLLALPLAAGGNVTVGARDAAKESGVILQVDGHMEYLDLVLKRLVEDTSSGQA